VAWLGRRRYRIHPGFDKVVIHPRCKGTIAEFTAYSYKQDRLTGDILPAVQDKDNHYIDALRYALAPMIKHKSKPVMTGAVKFSY